MAEQPERTAIIVIEAAAYRDDAIAPFVTEGAQTPLIPEDVWAPQVHLSLASIEHFGCLIRRPVRGWA